MLLRECLDRIGLKFTMHLSKVTSTVLRSNNNYDVMRVSAAENKKSRKYCEINRTSFLEGLELENTTLCLPTRKEYYIMAP